MEAERVPRSRGRQALVAALWLGTAAVPFALAAIRSAPRETVTPPPAASRAPTAAHATPPTRSVANVSQLMAGLIDPAADIVWESVGTVVTAAGTDERRPRTDKEWEAVRNAALHLTEGGNLLMLDDRAKDRDAWWRMSRALVDAGAVALEAAERRNVQAVFDAGEGITLACDTCHAVYWREEGASAPTPTPPTPRPSPQPTADRDRSK